ncbi:hypothetical protein [Embleya sp. NPDC020630]|uniref:hypothetical protein n=1 Tax=Embleya sp. NPDC020630 TaxID=3363979 RepID=UPI0037B4A6F1
MDTTDPTPIPVARRIRTRITRLGRALTAHALRGAATGAGTTAGSWITWWLLHR